MPPANSSFFDLLKLSYQKRQGYLKTFWLWISIATLLAAGVVGLCYIALPMLLIKLGYKLGDPLFAAVGLLDVILAVALFLSLVAIQCQLFRVTLFHLRRKPGDKPISLVDTQSYSRVLLAGIVEAAVLIPAIIILHKSLTVLIASILFAFTIPLVLDNRSPPYLAWLASAKLVWRNLLYVIAFSFLWMLVSNLLMLPVVLYFKPEFNALPMTVLLPLCALGVIGLIIVVPVYYLFRCVLYEYLWELA